MNWFSKIFLTLILFSWQNPKSNPFTIQFQNDLGEINLNLPSEFNRYYKTYKRSDCGCTCARIWYTYYNSELDNFPYRDTLDYFMALDRASHKRFALTVSQPGCSDKFIDKPIEIEKQLRRDLDTQLDEFGDLPFKDSTIVIIANRAYSLTSYRLKAGVNYHENVEAATIINGQPIYFNFERIGKDSTDFIQIAKEIMETVRIEK